MSYRQQRHQARDGVFAGADGGEKMATPYGVPGSTQKLRRKKTFMATSSRKKAAFSRLALSGLVVVTMLAAMVHFTAFTAHAGQASLSWSPPTTNTDGTPITNLKGYKVYVGTTSRSYDQKFDVGNSTSYSLNSLADGSTYYFAVTAYNTSGVESTYSNEATKDFPALPVTHKITATAGAGGTITALNNSNVSTASSGSTTITSVTVTDGAGQSFSIAPASGYAVSDVNVDGTSVGALTSYTFSSVKADHTLSATFAAKTVYYTITASAGTGGSITPSGTATLAAGANQTYSIAAAAGYKIASVAVDGASLGAVSSYSFSNLNANHTIAATFVASTTSTSTGTTTFAVNSGGTQYASTTGTTYLADTKYSGGNIGTTTATIANTTDDALYQKERYGNFSYSIPVTNGSYSVTLKFAETYFSASGQRIFSVTINGQTVISNLDIYATVGKNTAYDVTVPVNVANGAINISFTSSVNNAKINAIRVAPSTNTTSTSGTVLFADNAGGAQYTSSTGVTYQADSKYSGGSVGTTTSTIANTTDDPLYQKDRYGNFSYAVPATNGNYQVTLKFAENYWTAAGKRIFSVQINGQTVISNLDIYAKVGKNVAYDVTVPVSVTNGSINIKFVSQTNYAKVNAILVKSM